MPQDFLTELTDVQSQVMAATETEHISFDEFIRLEAAGQGNSPVAGLTHCAAVADRDT